MKIITGLFFRNRAGFDIEPDTEVESTIIINPELLRNVFCGVILPEQLNTVCGFTSDAYGAAEIFKYKDTSTSLSFEKKYHDKDDVIYYLFEHKEGNEWLGTWRGKTVGIGCASCVITPVSDMLFNEVRFSKILPPFFPYSAVDYVNIT